MSENENQQQDVVEGVVVEEDMAAVKQVKHTFLWLVIIILIVIVAGLSWLGFKEIKHQQSILTTLSAQVEKNQITPLEKELSQLKQNTEKETKALNQQLNTLNEADANLAKKIAEIAALQELTNEDIKRTWIISEVKFLLQMANQQLLLADDVENARTALVLADQQLKELADPRLYQLRALLADEELALASVTKVDIDGLAAQLQSAIESVDSLKVLTGPEYSAGHEEGSAKEKEAAKNWKDALTKAWQQVRSLVVIRHQQDGSAAIIVPEQRYFLYQNLRLKLETARLALLSKNETVFHDSLSSAQLWLEKYFIGEERDALMQTITNMQSETITVKLPDISASLVWLQQKGDL